MTGIPPYVVDTRTGAVGRVVGPSGGYVRLRAPGGGREWDAPPEALRLVAARSPEELRVRVTELNHLSRLPR